MLIASTKQELPGVSIRLIDLNWLYTECIITLLIIKCKRYMKNQFMTISMTIIKLKIIKAQTNQSKVNLHKNMPTFLIAPNN